MVAKGLNPRPQSKEQLLGLKQICHSVKGCESTQALFRIHGWDAFILLIGLINVFYNNFTVV